MFRVEREGDGQLHLYGTEGDEAGEHQGLLLTNVEMLRNQDTIVCVCLRQHDNGVADRTEALMLSVVALARERQRLLRLLSHASASSTPGPPQVGP